MKFHVDQSSYQTIFSQMCYLLPQSQGWVGTMMFKTMNTICFFDKMRSPGYYSTPVYPGYYNFSSMDTTPSKLFYYSTQDTIIFYRWTPPPTYFLYYSTQGTIIFNRWTPPTTPHILLYYSTLGGYYVFIYGHRPIFLYYSTRGRGYKWLSNQWL